MQLSENVVLIDGNKIKAKIYLLVTKKISGAEKKGISKEFVMNDGEEDMLGELDLPTWDDKVAAVVSRRAKLYISAKVLN